MSEYLVDESKNLVPYSEPSVDMPIISVSLDMSSAKVLYCNDYGNSKNYILNINFSGSANTRYFSLRSCQAGENVGYLVRIIGRGRTNFFGTGSNQFTVSVCGVQLNSDTPWYGWCLGYVLDEDENLTVNGTSSASWNGASLAVECIKLW